MARHRQIPDDRPADGAFYMLRDKSLADVRVLVEGLAKQEAATGTPTQQIPAISRQLSGLGRP